MAQEASLEIESIAAGGDGVGRSSGLVVFVPRTAPGDIVTARISGKGRFARGSLRAIARSSGDRIEPPCQHYTRDRCGGCQIQHIAYTAQLRAKQRIVRDALERIGKRETLLPEIHGSEHEWRYRTKLTLAMKRMPGGEWLSGLHPFDDPGRIFALNDCPITDVRVVETWRAILQRSEFFPAVQSLRGSVRLTADGPVFNLIGAMRWPGASPFFDSQRTLAAMWWENDEGTRRLMGDRRLTGPLGYPAASFSQVNPVVASRLRAHVSRIVTAHGPTTVVDAYSGAGDTAVEFTKNGAQVTAIELDDEAARWCALRLPAGSTSVTGRVEEVLARVLPADAVVLNPPRAGTDERVTQILEQVPRKPSVLVYVSCNPATLARDVARLPSYRIASLVAFDMFPQTAHVETVCEMVPQAA